MLGKKEMADNTLNVALKDQPTHRSVFVILTSGRCGSSLLMSYLNQIPDVICYPEILAGLEDCEQKEMLEALVDGTEQDWISEQFASGYNDYSPFQKDQSKVVAAGFKTKYGDIVDLGGFIRFSQLRHIKVLYITRTNIMRSALSRLRAIKLHDLYGDYNISSPKQKLGPTTVDIDEFSKLLAEEQNNYDSLNDIVMQFSSPLPGVLYENLVNDTTGQLNYVLDYLGSAYRVTYKHVGRNAGPWILNSTNNKSIEPLVQKVLKMTSNSFPQVITNHAEFIEHFRKTEYSKFLD